MLRRMLLAASGSDRTRQLITSAPVTRSLVARYVAGETTADAVEVTRDLLASGLLVTLDHLGEDTGDPDQAAAATAEYTGLLSQLAAAGLAQGGRAEVSVKPTAVGLGLAEHGVKTATENIARICAAARNAGTTVTVDMEEHTRVDATLRIVAELRPDYPDLGCVIQSQLRRTVADCAALARPGSRVRLCKGAYDAPDSSRLPHPARRGPQLRPRAAGADERPGLPDAGHPRPAADPDRRGAGGAGRPAAGELRVPDAVRGPPGRAARGWPARGAQLRVYLPYGSDWYRYLVRRLAERPANVSFFLRSLASAR